MQIEEVKLAEVQKCMQDGAAKEQLGGGGRAGEVKGEGYKLARR